MKFQAESKLWYELLDVVPVALGSLYAYCDYYICLFMMALN